MKQMACFMQGHSIPAFVGNGLFQFEYAQAFGMSQEAFSSMYYIESIVDSVKTYAVYYFILFPPLCCLDEMPHELGVND